MEKRLLFCIQKLQQKSQNQLSLEQGGSRACSRVPELITMARKMSLILLVGKPGGHLLLDSEGRVGALPEPQGLRVREFCDQRGNR